MSVEIKLFHPEVKDWQGLNEDNVDILEEYLQNNKKRFWKNYLLKNGDIHICEYLYDDFYNILEKDKKIIKLFNNCFC